MGKFADYFRKLAEARRAAAIEELNIKINNLTAEKNTLKKSLGEYEAFGSALRTLSLDLLNSSTKLEETYQTTTNAIQDATITRKIEKYDHWANTINNTKASIDGICTKVDNKIAALKTSIDDIGIEITKAQAKLTDLGG